ncbi:LOW QUALITY PROTEIN: gasdermin-B [Cervus elaphus]|uniref:LOW QUALITY PROTEIN: gasdermin-B n=1 Tax=Cervus elaphus TaxID=9860 RepID=UPI001CC2ADB4|nr:LOW QUALITY PROTEIN: gasdermin-B [Cervus elaphus]
MQIKDNMFLFPRSLASASWRALEEERGEGSVEHGSNPLLVVPILYSPKTQWPGTVQRPYTEGILTTSIFVGPGTMPTLFESVTRVVVEELDNSGELIAVRSFTDADKFHCFCLVKKRRRFFGYQYDKTNLTLKDILESEVPFDMVVPEFQGDLPDSGIKPASPALPEHSLPLSCLGNPHSKAMYCQDGNFEILDVEDSKENWTVKFSPKMTFKIAFHIFHEMNIKLKKCEIPFKFLDSLRNKKLKKELPSSFQSIQAKREDLYLVTETVKIAKTETLKCKKQLSFQILLELSDLQYESKNEEEVTITPEKVLAYRVKQLVFPSAERMDICFFDETRSFPEEKDGGSPWLGESLSLESFQSITERVQGMVRVLQDLTPEEQKEVLNCLTKCLHSDEELQDLERRVSEVQCSGELQMNNAANSLISSLFNAAGVLIEARAETIWDILDALKELSEVRQFVAEALDKGTLPHMKDKVEPVLEENWGEGPLDVSCDPEARTACALYVVVSILLQLGEKPISASS